MKWLGKHKVVSPEVVHGLVVATYSSREDYWTFEYEGVEYLAYGHRLNLLGYVELEAIHSDILALVPEMKERLRAGWKNETDGVASEGTEYFVNISEFHAQGEFGVCWTGDASWGDMGVEFTLHNRRIVGEEWGD